MVRILNDNGHLEFETSGMILEVICELQVATVEVLKTIMKDTPEDIKPTLLDMYIKTLKMAFDEFIK